MVFLKGTSSQKYWISFSLFIFGVGDEIKTHWVPDVRCLFVINDCPGLYLGFVESIVCVRFGRLWAPGVLSASAISYLMARWMYPASAGPCTFAPVHASP